ncbi:MAG: NAD(P)/FAD-dependent oxidoreductase, partial [Alphaproteobacteria bacterium]
MDEPKLSRECEIAVVGGGIAGLVTALNLARAGREVVVLERGEPWGESSGANAGTISILAMPPSEARLCRETLRLWDGMRRELGASVGFAAPGGLCVALSEAEVAALGARAVEQRAVGTEVEIVTGATLERLAPWLGPAVRAAAWSALDGFSSPLETGRALIDALRAAGVGILAGAGVTGIEPATGPRAGFRLATSRGALACRTVVIAAGAWSGSLARMLGVEIPIYVDVNMLTVTEPMPPFMDRVVTHVGGMLSLKQFANGACLVGGGWQGRGGFAAGRRDVDYERVVHNLRLAARVAPSLRGARVARSWAGYEGLAVDVRPLFGRLPGYEAVFIVACARGGFLLGPVLGRLMAELVLEGRTSLPVDAYDPARFQPAPAAGADSAHT